MPSRCVNEKCKKNPEDSMDRVIANADGDLACDKKCLKEYERQRDHFFKVIVHDEGLTTRYLRGEDV